MPPLRVEIGGFLRGLSTLEGAVVNAAGMALREGVRAVEESGRGTKLFRDRTGQTRQSIRGTYESPYRAFVTFGGASRLLQSGTKPHVIVGRPTLRFVVAGEVFFRRMVRHPGTAPRPFVTEARQKGEEVLYLALHQLLGEAIRRVH